MKAYLAINGNDTTAKLYEKELSKEELAAGVLPYKSFDAAVKALTPFRPTHAIGIIDLGYVVPARVPAAAPEPEPQPEPEPEPEPIIPNPESES